MSGTSPTNFVLKAYLTEANARADSNALKVTTNTAYLINKDQDANYNFFTHVEYFFRIESNHPVVEFYIDWDDGEDNDPKGNANYTLIKLDSPDTVGITSHIFTRDKLHYPKIRVKDTDGFLSKFYQAAGDTTFEGIDILAEGDALIDAGRNDRYRIENDVASGDTGDSDGERIPVFGPTPRPPVGILKADKKRVFAGITNKYLAGTGGEHNGSTCVLIGSHQGIDAGRSEVKVKVTYYTTGGNDQNDLTNTGSGELITTEMTLGATPTITNVLKVVKMELVDLLEASDDATSISTANKLFPGEKLILVVDNGSGAYQDDTPSVIGEVSLGNPIVTLDDPRHTVTFDATESFARSPETTIDEYRIWDGDKMTNFGYDENQAILAASATDISDIFSAGSGIDTLRTPSGIKSTSYAFHPSMTFTDEYHRWLPQQLLAICQVKSSEAAVKTATGFTNDTRATYRHSFIEHWVDESQSDNYGEDRAGIAEYNWPDDMTSSGFMAFRGADDEDNWDDLNPFNRLVGEDNQHTLFQQTKDATHTDADRLYGKQTSLDQVGAEGGYLVCARDSKWTKQHFQTRATGSRDNSTAPYRAAPITVNTAANKTTDNEWTGTSQAGVRVEIFYTAREDTTSNIVWKPLKYINNTKHPYLNDSTFYTSGTIEWVEPDDWVECDPGDIPDRYWPGNDFEDGGSVAFSFDSDASGNYFDVSNRWNATNKKFGLLWVIHGDGNYSTGSSHARFGYGPDVSYSFPASNKHSTLIDVIDPMHVSLNTHALTQSVSYIHKGKYQIIEDRMGRAEIRKIGATGGKLTFGGVDLKDSDGTLSRDKYYEYQKRATPVYIDITHKSGNISRFFGVITDMSEDHPVGLQFGKFGLTLQCSHMIYMNSSGNILSDGYVSLGGDLIDEFRYI
tara:strand:- start:1090 stop:3810 length:2721 start_codon:yes stop_codon:yes gene_type:complete